MPKSRAGKSPHKANTDKLLRTERTRARRAAVVAARKFSKPQPKPQAGRAAKRAVKFAGKVAA